MASSLRKSAKLQGRSTGGVLRVWLYSGGRETELIFRLRLRGRHNS